MQESPFPLPVCSSLTVLLPKRFSPFSKHLFGYFCFPMQSTSPIIFKKKTTARPSVQIIKSKDFVHPRSPLLSVLALFTHLKFTSKCPWQAPRWHPASLNPQAPECCCCGNAWSAERRADCLTATAPTLLPQAPFARGRGRTGLCTSLLCHGCPLAARISAEKGGRETPGRSPAGKMWVSCATELRAGDGNWSESAHSSHSSAGAAGQAGEGQQNSP